MEIKTLVSIKALRMLMVAMAVLPLAGLVSCDSFVYDYEGDCSVTYRLRFRYDKNLKWADAFANEIKSVNVYAFDKNGILVWQKSENGPELAADGYAMKLELPAGDYRLIAWCGLDNAGGKKSFSVPDMTAGISRIEELQCSLNRNRAAALSERKSGDGQAYSDTNLDFLFHGMRDVSLPQNDDGSIYDYIMPLTKDTNHVRIILQHISASDVNVDDFTFMIEDDNGLMAHNNELLDDEIIAYHAWDTHAGSAGIISGDEVINCATAVADITVARMTAEHDRKMILTIARKDGETVARVPVIDYALLAKDYYEEAYGHKMTDQDFLDREDEYAMTFFLDESNKWISSHILIHSWRVVPSDIDIE